MNDKTKNILTALFTFLLALLGGSQYQQSAQLNAVQQAVKDQNVVVESLAHRDLTRYEAE